MRAFDARISWWSPRVSVAREALLERIRAAIARSPVTVLTGPRQAGKTTLARQLLSEDSPNYFDLEDPVSLARLEEPRTALESLEGLAGRMERIEIGGFSRAELGAQAAHALWPRGAFPLAWLARTEEDSFTWRRQFIQTLLERDLPQWGVRTPAVALLRFWTMLAHDHGQVWSATELAKALGVDPSTTRRHLDLLSDALMVRQLQPWHANLRKRQLKAPKVYVRDSGLLHQLLGLQDEKALLSHPKLGASWEGFAIEQVLATEPHDEACFWGTHQGAEIDLLLRRGDRLLGVECKRADAPKLTPSMRIALEDLGLERLAVIYPGAKRYPLSAQVEVVPLATLAEPGRLFDADR
jgi:hypothetical protein